MRVCVGGGELWAQAAEKCPVLRGIPPVGAAPQARLTQLPGRQVMLDQVLVGVGEPGRGPSGPAPPAESGHGGVQHLLGNPALPHAAEVS